MKLPPKQQQQQQQQKRKGREILDAGNVHDETLRTKGRPHEDLEEACESEKQQPPSLSSAPQKDTLPRLSPMVVTCTSHPSLLPPSTPSSCKYSGCRSKGARRWENMMCGDWEAVVYVCLCACVCVCVCFIGMGLW